MGRSCRGFLRRDCLRACGNSLPRLLSADTLAVYRRPAVAPQLLVRFPKMAAPIRELSPRFQTRNICKSQRWMEGKERGQKKNRCPSWLHDTRILSFGAFFPMLFIFKTFSKLFLCLVKKSSHWIYSTGDHKLIDSKHMCANIPLTEKEAEPFIVFFMFYQNLKLLQSCSIPDILLLEKMICKSRKTLLPPSGEKGKRFLIYFYVILNETIREK